MASQGLQGNVFVDFRAQLLERMQRVQEAITQLGPTPELLSLVNEVESALGRMKDGTFGFCETCHDPIESDRLLADPLLRFCLDHLTSRQQRALEQDLELARRIQTSMLPQRGITFDDWEIDFFYQPAEIVGGDYCDLIVSDNVPGVTFVAGDVSGKGVAASMLATHLHGLFHSLSRFQLPIEQLMEHANRLFCESTLAAHYATLVCGQTHANGELELCSAGHFPALFIQASGVTRVPANTVPLGLFCSLDMETTRLKLQGGDSLLLYTDGIVEAMQGDREYGIDRLCELVGRMHSASAQEIIAACLGDVRVFLRGTPADDDVTLMVIRRKLA